ncbi:MAG: nucleoside hydrolase, partial [Opitutaceae bacterium]
MSRKIPQSVWLDTDIGDDTDDILALSLICASPELRLAGVSTVLGETENRARVARTLLVSTARARDRIRVAAGCGQPLPGKITPDLWPNGPVNRPWMAQLPCARPASRLPRAPAQHGVERLAALLRRHPGETIPIGIGPMTNLATLLLREPALQAAIPRLALMAGEFKRPMAEWNVRCDPLAMACLTESGLPIDFLPWDIGMKCTVRPAQLARLFAARSPTGRLLSRAIRLWQKAKSKPGRLEHPHLYDPMAVAMVSHPEWFEWRRGRVQVSFAPRTFARTQF